MGSLRLNNDLVPTKVIARSFKCVKAATMKIF
jgi:hypothetical protein